MRTATQRWMALVAASFLIAASAAADDGGRPGREILLPSEEVKDTFLGYLVGLIENDVAARLDREYLLGILFELRDAPTFQLISEIAWFHGEGLEARLLSFTFNGELHFPVPLELFGRPPASIDASSMIVLREEPWGGGSDPLGGPFHRFSVEQGYASVDFAEWLDVLADSLLDDFSVAAVALFTYRGRRHAMLVGRGERGQAVPWAFDLSRNRIMFPLPERLYDLADLLLRGE